MNNKIKYKGVVVPVVTPLTVDFKLDEPAIEKMFNHFHKHHAMPFINGTTGESASLNLNLKKDYIKAAGKFKIAGDVLYAGISSNCLEESIELAKTSFDSGVDAVAATLPSHYHLSTDQMRKYFEQLAEQVPGPVIIYNIPVTTHMSIPLEVIDELSRDERFIGTKDSERNEERLQQSLELWSGREDFCHFMGWAGKSAEALINGSDGLIPSTGNICPGIYDDMIKAIYAGDHDEAFRLQKLSDALGNVYQNGKLLGESLWALKVLMQELYLCNEYIMPPLRALSAADKNKLIKNFHQIVDQGNLIIKTDTNV
ncbi:dihydrodipicolinate synthase family protein [Mucilaginibacter sp.]|uniref:dihydrodipicolinate synthase family protein n=1 Tax=Mucilaginibacter sp. TaxID=1882438 RepID=UPI00260C39E1|nr:dihydrodipicolinate synthase family protein [Mucilaginibacter sp.]MDB4919541.1 4-hydroxy-tetrahydrodipicolinate synthase [Mucilaginibacter sp.]